MKNEEIVKAIIEALNGLTVKEAKETLLSVRLSIESRSKITSS